MTIASRKWRKLTTPLASTLCFFVCACVGCAADCGLYHTYEELDDELHGLAAAFPQIASVSTIGESVEGRQLWALKISDNVESTEDEPVVVFLGGHHGREWISVEVPFLVANHLVRNYQSDPVISNLVDNCEIWFVPMVNPDGHQYSVNTNRLWRKNRRDNGDGTFGVDLNRNYSYMWGGEGSSGNSSSQTYRGPDPFSEPETMAVRDFLNELHLDAFVTYHNYGQMVLYPWFYTGESVPENTDLIEVGQGMTDDIASVNGEQYEFKQGFDNYVSSGDATDWLFSEQSIPSYTIELPSQGAPPGFMLPADQINKAFEENLPGAVYLVNWVVGQSQKGTKGTR